MTWTTSTVLGVIAIISGVIVCLAMILWFLWMVYNRGGADDVGSVAKALREVYDPEWPTQAFRFLGSTAQDDARGTFKDDEEEDKEEDTTNTA